MRKSTQLLLVICSITFFSPIAAAQYVFVPDQKGKPLTETRYENLTGTPYLTDQWTNGEVKMANGEIIKPSALKYDMVNDKLLFQENGKVYEFYPSVASFVLNIDGVKRVFLLKDYSKTSSYFEVLNNDKITLLKKVRKTILEVKGYNSANLEKTVDENKKYFLVGDNLDIEIKLTIKSLVQALPQYKTQIETSKLKIGRTNPEKDVVSIINILK